MDGSLIIDKPAGITSHDVVARVRRALEIRRVGHAGTLDPFATGVLLVCVGRATRLTQYLSGLNKEYLAVVRLGFATDTQDLTGTRISELADVRGLTGEKVRSVLAEFTGDQEQIPPMFSAKQIDGQRLYKLARAGKTIDRKPIQIRIHSMDPIESEGSLLRPNQDGTADFTLLVKCSSGAYIRTLAHDIGERLGCGGHLASLRRTAVGAFTIERSVPLEEFELRAARGEAGSFLIAPSETIGHLPGLTLNEDEVARVKNGRDLVFDASRMREVFVRIRDERGEQAEACTLNSRMRDAFVRLCDGAGGLVAVGEVGDDGQTVRPRTVLAAGD